MSEKILHRANGKYVVINKNIPKPPQPQAYSTNNRIEKIEYEIGKFLSFTVKDDDRYTITSESLTEEVIDEFLAVCAYKPFYRFTEDGFYRTEMWVDVELRDGKYVKIYKTHSIRDAFISICLQGSGGVGFHVAKGTLERESKTLPTIKPVNAPW